MKTAFETDRLLLVETTVNDAAFVLELMNSPKWVQHIGDRGIRSIKDAENYISDRKEEHQSTKSVVSYTLIKKGEQTKIGSCGIYDRAGIVGVDLGYALLPAYEGNGFALEAAKKLMEIAFNNLLISKVSAVTTTQNIASQSILKKIGMLAQGKISLPNDPNELLLFTIQAM